MKRTNRILSFMMALAIAVLPLSTTVFAETNIESGNLDKLLDTYFYNTKELPSASKNQTVQDPYGMLDSGSTINSNKLIEMFATDTNSKSELLKLSKDIQDGEKLADHMKSEQGLYTITTDSKGNATGYAVIDLGSFTVKEAGELNEYTRKDLQLTKSMQANIEKLDLDLSTSKVVMCTIINFAKGTLIYDKNNEYFIPSIEGIESAGLIEFGSIYPVNELAKTIENNIDSIFPTNQVDENGNPYLGGMAIQTESTEHDRAEEYRNPQTGVSIDQLESVEPEGKGNTQGTIYHFSIGIIGLIILSAIVIKAGNKCSYKNIYK